MSDERPDRDNSPEAILARVKKQSPAEQAKFARDVFRHLEEIPMRTLLRDPKRPMSPADWLAVRAWVLGVEGAAKPAFVLDEAPAGGAAGLEEMRLALRAFMQINP